MMTTTARAETPLIVPRRLQQKAGIKEGDQLKFAVARHTITSTVVDRPSYHPSRAELAAMRKGEAAIARGEYVTLTDLLHDLERRRRKAGAKGSGKISR
jgi:predicted transcriptional regulator